MSLCSLIALMYVHKMSPNPGIVFKYNVWMDFLYLVHFDLWLCCGRNIVLGGSWDIWLYYESNMVIFLVSIWDTWLYYGRNIVLHSGWDMWPYYGRNVVHKLVFKV